MKKSALGDLTWDERPLGPGFVDRNKHLTYAAVGEGYRVGILIEGPLPGMRLAPRHYHMLEEEPALILEGPDSNEMQVRALRTEHSIFDMSGVRRYLDGEPAI